MTSNTDIPAEEYTANITTEPAPEPSRLLEVSFAAVALVFSIVYLVLALQIELRREAAPGQIDARFWPVVLGVIAIVVSVALLILAFIKQPDSRDDLEARQPGGMVRVGLTLIISLLYVAFWNLKSVIIAGYQIELFPIATVLYILALLLLFGQRKIVGLIVYPIAITAFIWVLFGMLLRIPL